VATQSICPKRVAIRAPNWLGDAVMAMPAVARLREACPDAVLDVWTRPGLAGLWRMMPAVNAVREVDDGGASGPLRQARLLRPSRYDAGILLTNSLRAALSMALAGVPRRIGTAAAEGRIVLTHRVRAAEPIHQVDRYLTLAASLGGRLDRCAVALTIPAAARVWADAQLQKGDAAGGAGREWVALHAGAAYGSAKRWPAERFVPVVTSLVRERDLRVVFVGSGPERAGLAPLIEPLQGAFPDGRWGCDLIGATTIERLAAVLARCRLAIGNDSGPLHLASVLHVPLLALFGPTDPRVTGPWGPVAAVLRRDVSCAPCLRRACPTDHSCMLGIGSDDVLREALRLLDARGAAR